MCTPTRHVAYAESWYRTWCPYCTVVNWHCNGNESSNTGIDVEAVKCRGCRGIYRLGEPDAILEEVRGDGDLKTEDGVEMLETKKVS